MRKASRLIILFLLAFPLFSQEYWKDFFFFNDPQGFDRPPYQGMELSHRQAESSGTYTEVLYSDGLMLEALSYVKNDPEYFYSFHYTSQGDPLLRRSFYVDDFLELYPLNELFYHYDNEGLLAVTLLEYNLFDRSVKNRQFTKVREGGLMKSLDAFQIESSVDLLKRLEQEEETIRTSLPLTSLLLDSTG